MNSLFCCSDNDNQATIKQEGKRRDKFCDHYHSNENNSKQDEIKLGYRTHPAILANIPLSLGKNKVSNVSQNFCEKQTNTLETPSKRIIFGSNQDISCEESPGTTTRVNYEASEVFIRRVLIVNKPTTTSRVQNYPTSYDDYNADIEIDTESFHGPPFGLQLVGGSKASNQLLASGIFVAHVVPGSQAEGVGIKLGDQILAIRVFESQPVKKEVKHREVPSLNVNNVCELLQVAASTSSQVSLLVMSAKGNEKKQENDSKQMLVGEDCKVERTNLATIESILQRDYCGIEEGSFHDENDANKDSDRSTKLHQFQKSEDLHLMMLEQRQRQHQFQHHLSQDIGLWRLALASSDGQGWSSHFPSQTVQAKLETDNSTKAATKPLITTAFDPADELRKLSRREEEFEGKYLNGISYVSVGGLELRNRIAQQNGKPLNSSKPPSIDHYFRNSDYFYHRDCLNQTRYNSRLLQLNNTANSDNELAIDDKFSESIKADSSLCQFCRRDKVCKSDDLFTKRTSIPEAVLVERREEGEKCRKVEEEEAGEEGEEASVEVEFEDGEGEERDRIYQGSKQQRLDSGDSCCAEEAGKRGLINVEERSWIERRDEKQGRRSNNESKSKTKADVFDTFAGKQLICGEQPLMESTASLFLGAASALQRVSSLSSHQNSLFGNIEPHKGEGEEVDLEGEYSEHCGNGQRKLVSNTSGYYNEDNNEFFRQRNRQIQPAAKPIDFSTDNRETSSYLQRNYFSASLDSLIIIPEDHLAHLSGKQSFSQKKYLNLNNDIIDGDFASDRQVEYQYSLLDADSRANVSISLTALERSSQLSEGEELDDFGNFRNTATVTREQIALNINNERLDDDERLLLSPIANSLSLSPLLDLNSTNLNSVMSSDCLDRVGPTSNKEATLNEKAVKQNYVTESYNQKNNNDNLLLEHQDDHCQHDKLVGHARHTGSMWPFSSSAASARDQGGFNLTREQPVARKPTVTVNEVRPEQQNNRLLITSDPFSGNLSTGGLGTARRLGDRRVLGSRGASSECNLSSVHHSTFSPANLDNHQGGRVGLEPATIRKGANQTGQPFVNIGQPFINAAGDFPQWATREFFADPSPYNSSIISQQQQQQQPQQQKQKQYRCNTNICNDQQELPIEWQEANQFWPANPLSNDVSYLNKYDHSQMEWPPLPNTTSNELAPLESSSSYPTTDPQQLSSAIANKEDWTINNKQQRRQVCSNAEIYCDSPSNFSFDKLTFPNHNQYDQQQRHPAPFQDQASPLSSTRLKPRCCSSMSVPFDNSSAQLDGPSYFNSITTFHAPPFSRNSLADSNQYQWRPHQVQLELHRRQQEQRQCQQQHNYLQLRHDKNESPNLMIENDTRGAQTSSLNELTNVPAISSLISSPIANDKLVPFNGNAVERQLVEQDHDYPPHQEASHSPSLTQNNRSRRHRRRYYRSQSPHQNISGNNDSNHQNHYQLQQQQHPMQQQQQPQRQHRRRSRSIQLKYKPPTRFPCPTQTTNSNEDEEATLLAAAAEGRGENGEEECGGVSNIGQDEDESDSGLSLVTAQAEGRLPMSVAEQMKEQASNFVNQYGGVNSGKDGGKRRSNRKPNLQVRRTLRVKIKKLKPILGIAIEGGFNVSGQLLPRIVCVHEDGAAYQCGKLRASDLILEVNGTSTVNMTHDEIAKTIATAYYQDPRSYIEFLIGESIQV